MVPFTSFSEFADHPTINGFDLWRYATHHRDSRVARDLLRADGAEDKVTGFDHTATLDTALHANAVQEGVPRG